MAKFLLNFFFINQFQDKLCLIKIFQVLKAIVYKLCNVYIAHKQGFADKRYLRRHLEAHRSAGDPIDFSYNLTCIKSPKEARTFKIINGNTS